MSLLCPKCGKEYKEDDDDLIPKVFKCGDTLCQKCIKNIYETDKINCPVCHIDIDQKIDDLPTNKFVIDVKKSILCDKCLKEYSNSISGERAPKILKCGDTFCLKCLEELSEKGKGKIICYFCGKETTEEICNMPDNLYIIDLAQHELYTNVKYLSDKNIAPKDLGYLFSLGLMGESHGGKTSITHYFHTGESFIISPISTIGYDYHYKYISINNKFVKVSLMDTAGQERFGCLAAGMLRGVHGLLLVFGLTFESQHYNYNKWKNSTGEEKIKIEEEMIQNKFKALEFWLEQFYQFNKQEKRVIYLIGNKVDDLENRIIKKEEAKKFAKAHKLKYFETSAKTGENIFNVFENLIIDLIKKYPKKIEIGKEIKQLVIPKPNPKPDSHCC